ncbi:hypothetical protein P280DRAFT_471647 [Massarina eburnea CBS 473.64]|uniref:Allergen n=1 Tax=Massarina eburnea CBS 473.64 TaxID=1395130 RepID=A0A6A6RTI0_9PLEO|nr:hypothetical protein P280DRAFT_471647 [Massarina eburnea CBS 473.64]
MDKAKVAVSDFMSKAGKHDTTVHETVAPAVQHETVKSHEHENITTAVDKEAHQDHYHRTVQPVQDREVLPEEHEAKLGAVQHREFDHRDHESTKRNLAREQAEFKDQRVVEDMTHSQSAAPTIGGEHVHHHIHETIQPVVHKETIQPHVTHTTVPIHEVHHNQAQHHQSTQLPAMSMSEFKNKGGALHGREERYDGFEGEPKHIGGSIKDMMHDKTSKRESGTAHGLHESSKHGDFDPLDGRSGTSHAVGTGGAVGGGSVGGAERGIDGVGAERDIDGVGATGRKEALGSHATSVETRSDTTGTTSTSRIPGTMSSHTAGSGVGTGAGPVGAGGAVAAGGPVGGGGVSHGTTKGNDLHQTTSQQSKPGLMQKLNPFADSDGDGKKGIMD